MVLLLSFFLACWAACFQAQLAFASGDSQPQAAQPEAAELVLHDGQIYSMDAGRSWAQSIAISKGKIVFVGSNDKVKSYIGPDTHVVPLEGRLVLPGFQDSHVHLMGGGTQLNQLHLDEAKTSQETLQDIKNYAAAHPPSAMAKDSWIVGSGWSLPLFPDANPQATDLDSVVPDRPVFLWSQDWHSAWLNSRALQLAGITKGTADPPHGRIEHNAQGEPSGTLREAATDLGYKVAPHPDRTERVEGLKRAVELANKFGITSVQDADADEEVLDAYSELQKRDELTLNVVAALHVVPEKGESQIEELKKQRSRYTEGRLHATAAKLFADGVVEAHTASLLEPYTDEPNNSGISNYSAEQLKAMVTALSKAGFQVHIHAIGDRAVHDALDAHAASLQVNGNTDLRHTIAHLELISPADIPRFRDLSIVPNFQCFWAYNDPYISKCTLPALGAERTGRLYQVETVMQTGATVCGGSDWPVTTLNPLDAIQVAITRKALDDVSGKPWIAEERTNLPDILAAYTMGGAYVNHHDKETGSLEIGKHADLIVLDKNLFDIAPWEIHNAKVVLTLLDGKEVFRDDSFPDVNLALQHQDNQFRGNKQ